MSDRPSILVFRSAALGDFILASPALRMLRQLHPQHRIVLLSTQSANKNIRASVASYSPTDSMPWVKLAMPHLVDEVVAMDVSLAPRYLWALRKQLRAYHFEKVVLLLDPGAPWPGRIKKLLLLTFLVGAVPISGWRAKGSLNGDRAALYAAGLLPHHVHGSMHFMKEQRPPLPYTDADIQFDLRPPPAAQAWAQAWLQEHRKPHSRLVFVAPGSIQPHKRWPIEKFQALCSTLLAEFEDVQIVVIGTPSDRALGDVLRQDHPSRVHNIAGDSNVSQSAALLARPCLLVGNDGGAMHLGDAMGATVVSIVPGIQYPMSIEPWNSRRLAVRHAVPCAPCYNFVMCPQGHNRCMRDLEVQAVLDRCRQVLLALPSAADTVQA